MQQHNTDTLSHTATGMMAAKKSAPRTMRAEIWQLKQEAPAVLLYESFRHLKNYGLSFNQENYCLVYAFDHAGGCGTDALEMIFTRFNIDRPDDYRGHSLSVSDVIVIDGRAFYVDTIGFREVAWKSAA